MAKGLRSKSKRAFRTIKRCVRVQEHGRPVLVGRGGASSMSHPQASRLCLMLLPAPAMPSRQEVVKAPSKIEVEEKKQEAMAAVLAAPRPAPADGAADSPAAMEQDAAGGDGAMAVDGQGAGLTTSNPSKLLKKLRKQVGARLGG